MYQYDEICEGGGDHAGQSAPGDLEHPTAGYWLGLSDQIHHLLNILLLLPRRVAPPQSEEPDILEASVKRINFEVEHFKTNEEPQ